MTDHPLGVQIDQLNNIRDHLPVAADDGFIARLLFDRAMDVVNTAVQRYLVEERVPLPATAPERLALAIGRLGAKGARGLRESDLDFGVRQRNSSVHKGRPAESTATEAAQMESAARSLLVAMVQYQRI